MQYQQTGTFRTSINGSKQMHAFEYFNNVETQHPLSITVKMYNKSIKKKHKQSVLWKKNRPTWFLQNIVFISSWNILQDRSCVRL